jgi:hypothetical protein
MLEIVPSLTMVLARDHSARIIIAAAGVSVQRWDCWCSELQRAMMKRPHLYIHQDGSEFISHLEWVQLQLKSGSN